MPLKSLYTIEELQYADGAFSADLRFNPEHEIFEGHFPGQPVVPGVVLIHILKDISSSIAGSDVTLVKGTNIKFLSMIDPAQDAAFFISGTYYRNEDATITISATIQSKDRFNIKFKGIFSTKHITV